MLSDSDDSNDDFLLQPSVFAKPKPDKKQELTPIKTLEKILSDEPISEKEDGTDAQKGGKRKHPESQHRASNNDTRKKPKGSKQSEGGTGKSESPRERRQDDPEWIETQARKTVDEILRLDVVDKITDFNHIGWYRFTTKTSKAVLYWPAILSQNTAEARFLLQSKTNRRTETRKIQYIGVAWRHALTLDEIALSKWIPCSESTDSENEARLKNFVKFIAKSSLFKSDLVGLKIEEFAIRKMWERVRTQIEHKKLEQEQEEKEHEEARAAASNADRSIAPAAPRCVTQDSDSNSQSTNDEKDAGSVSDDTDNENDDDASISSPGRKPKHRTPLCVNDDIEYYEVIGTFGNPDSLCRATVVGVRPDNSSYPLLVSGSTLPIPGTHRVRRLPDGNWQPINEFALRKEGIQSMADRSSGLSENVQKARNIRDEVEKAKNDFWRNGSDPSEKNERGVVSLSYNEKKKKSIKIVSNGGRDEISNDAISSLPVRQGRRSSPRIRKKAN